MDVNKVAQKKALSNPKMEFIWNTVVDSFEWDESLKKNNFKKYKNWRRVNPRGNKHLFSFYRLYPNTSIFKGLIDMYERKYIKTNEEMERDITGIYAVRYCKAKILRHVATALGDLVVADFMVEKFIEEKNYIRKEIFETKGLIMAYVYNAVEQLDKEFLLRIEEVQKKFKEKIELRRIDIYKLYRVECKLKFKKSLSLIFIKKGEILETLGALSDIERSVEKVINKYQ